MAQTVYTSARDVDVKTCAPQPLVRSNFLAEYRTEADKAKVRRNLGINEENDLFWGNIQGFIELQKDLVDYIQKNLQYTTEVEEGITSIKEALDFIFEVVVDYTNHKEDYIVLRSEVDEITKTITSLQEHIAQIEESFNAALEQKQEDITSIQESLEEFKTEVSEFQETINTNLAEVQEALSEEMATLTETVNGFDDRISAVEGAFDLTYNTELSDNIKAPNKIGGINAGTTVEDLKKLTLIDIVDLLVFPSTVPTLNQPYVYYSINNQTIEVGTSLNPSLNFYQGDAGSKISETEVVTLDDVKITFEGYTKLGIYKHIGTVTYEAGEYLVDDRGNTTTQRVEAGSKSATLTITTTYPWYINNDKQQLVPFNKDSGTIEFNIGAIPTIKLPGSNSKITSFMVNGGSGFLEVNLDEAWEHDSDEINGVAYQTWTKKTAYVDTLPHKINFTLIE